MYITAVTQRTSLDVHTGPVYMSLKTDQITDQLSFAPCAQQY